MRQLSPAGQQVVDDIARRHGFTPDAVTAMLDAVIQGNGSMAQFNHPEFAGGGQWMAGGMIMLGDMFNNALKGRVDALCNELARVVASQPDLLLSGSFQSQSQGGGYQQQGGGYGQQQSGSGPGGPASLFVPAAGGGANWWPAELGWPASTGAQNNARYAYFPDRRRLAIDLNGQVTVYDTLDHQIGGFSQQQSYGGSLSFTSQYGLIDVATLPVVSGAGAAPAGAASAGAPSAAAPPVPATEAGASEADVFATLERLAQLHAKGILSDDEYGSKKAELLKRL